MRGERGRAVGAVVPLLFGGLWLLGPLDVRDDLDRATGWTRALPFGERSYYALADPEAQATAVPEHAFLELRPDGRPVSYPCGPVSYEIDERGSPPDGTAVVRDAMRRMAVASGRDIVFAGFTERAADLERGGPPWPPVLVRWSDTAEVARLGGAQALAVGGSSVAPDGSRFVTGEIVLAADRWLADGGLDGADELKTSVVLHEMGHVLGLDHVRSATEVMSDGQDVVVSEFGPGDRIGLRALRAACEP